jgi:hypothetical protein
MKMITGPSCYGCRLYWRETPYVSGELWYTEWRIQEHDP